MFVIFKKTMSFFIAINSIKLYNIKVEKINLEAI